MRRGLRRVYWFLSLVGRWGIGEVCRNDLGTAWFMAGYLSGKRGLE